MKTKTSPISGTGWNAFAFKKATFFAMMLSSILGSAQKVQLHYSGKNKKVTTAVAEANKILADPAFYAQIEQHNSFDNTAYTGKQISQEMQNLNKVIEVSTYWWPLSPSNAGTVSSIKVNTAKLNGDLASRTNTMVHETVHGVDYLTNARFDYTHDGNEAAGQGGTAPWVIGDIAEHMVEALPQPKVSK